MESKWKEHCSIHNQGMADIWPDCQGRAHNSHRYGIHRHVQPDAFLMVRAKAGVLVKVSGFGNSRQLTNDEHVVSTESYRSPFTAPECGKSLEQTKAVDVFSLGILIYFVLTDGCNPFGEGLDQQIANIRRKVRQIYKI